MGASRTLIMALAIAATMAVELAMATNYTVGDSGGWEIGPNFQAWASSKNFTIGDVLSYFSFLLFLLNPFNLFSLCNVILSSILVSHGTITDLCP